jgi:thioesterase domain-containing protein
MAAASLSGSNGSLVFFPDFGGNALYARHMVAQLSGVLDCYMMQFAPDMVRSLDKLSIESIGQRFAKDLTSAVISRPILLLGHSFAGFLAYETGRQMALRGSAPDSVWILDLPRRRRPGLREFLRDPRHHAVGIARHIKGNWRSIILRRRDPNILASYGVIRINIASHPEAYRYIIRSMHSALVAYEPQRSTAPTVLVRAAATKARPRLGDDLGWRELVTGPFRTETVPGDHLTMVRSPEHAEAISNLIRRSFKHDLERVSANE